jgi:hypothetical protein
MYGKGISIPWVMPEPDFFPMSQGHRIRFSRGSLCAF